MDLRVLVEEIAKKTKGKGPDGRKFKLSKCATADAIVSAETELGFVLPTLLKEIYKSVGNGGFGPGYGVMGIPGGFTDDQGDNIISLYNIYREPDPEDASWSWPIGLVPICHWGCVVYSCVHCLEEGNPVYYIDISAKEPDDPMESILIRHKISFEEWISDWLSGKDLWSEVWA